MAIRLSAGLGDATLDAAGPAADHKRGLLRAHSGSCAAHARSPIRRPWCPQTGSALVASPSAPDRSVRPVAAAFLGVRHFVSSRQSNPSYFERSSKRGGIHSASRSASTVRQGTSCPAVVSR